MSRAVGRHRYQRRSLDSSSVTRRPMTRAARVSVSRVTELLQRREACRAGSDSSPSADLRLGDVLLPHCLSICEMTTRLMATPWVASCVFFLSRSHRRPSRCRLLGGALPHRSISFIRVRARANSSFGRIPLRLLRESVHTTNAVGAAIVNAVGPIRQVVEIGAAGFSLWHPSPTEDRCSGANPTVEI